MRIRESIVMLGFGAILALEGWQLEVLFNLNAQVKVLSAELHQHMRYDPQAAAVVSP